MVKEGLSFWEYIFCILIVLSSGSLFSTDYSYLLYAIIIVFIIMRITGDIKIEYNIVPLTISIIGLTFLSVIQNLYYSNGEGFDAVFKNYLIIYCIVCFALSKTYHNKKRVALLVDIIIVVSIISNFFYLYDLLGPGLPLVESREANVPHFHYLFSSGINTIVGLDVRNGGIYWEPGMYQVYLTFALLYYLYCKDAKYRMIVVIYLIATSITTFSVTAYATMAALIGLYSLGNDSHVIKKILILVVVIVAFYYVYPIVKESMEMKQNSGSYSARSNDLFFGFDIFLRHPIFGCGIVNYEYANESMRVFGVKRFDSNGMMNVLINLGAVGFSIVLFYIISFGKWIKRNISKLMILGFYVWVLISANSEPIVFHPFFEFLVGVGISYSFSKKVKKSISPIVVS